MKKSFTGVFPVAVTPFKEDGSFDFVRAKAHLDYLIDGGVPGICLLGATGEYQSVTLDEHKAYVNEIVPYICNRVKVIVGATRERPDDVIDLVQNIKKAGGHGAMVLTPPYCHPAQNEIIENYRYIMEATEFPLVVYNNPGSCGVSIERDTFKELYALPQCAVIKESSCSMQKTTEVILDTPPQVSVFCGCDSLAFESFAAGACGWISMLANVAPRDCVALFDAVYNRHDLAAGMEIYKKLLPGLAHLESFPKPVQSLKYLLNKKTGNGGHCRRPRLALSEEEQIYVWKAMNADELK